MQIFFFSFWFCKFFLIFNTIQSILFRPYTIPTNVLHFKQHQQHSKKHFTTNRHCPHKLYTKKHIALTWPFCHQLLFIFFTLEAVSSAPPPPSPHMQESWDPADKHAGWAPSHLVPKNCGDILEAESKQSLPTCAVEGPTNAITTNGWETYC